MEHSAFDTVLEAKLNDCVRLAQNGGRPRFLGFLDEHGVALARRVMRGLCFQNYLLYGGHEDAERMIFGAFPDFMQPEESAFPIDAVTAQFRRCDSLSHRDFLGALLAQGIERETLGDLLVEEGRCVFFVRGEMTGYILAQVKKIGRVGVALRPGMEQPLPAAGRFEDFSAVVASARLDCIVAAAAGTSREKAAELIRAGMVLLDHVETESVSAPVAQGSLLSVRGKGRYVLDRIGPVTKKGRLSIAGRRYS